MPTNVVEVDAYTATVPVPDDTEDADSASLLQIAQPLANRTKNHKGRLDALDADLATAYASLFTGKYYSVGASTYNASRWTVDDSNTNRMGVQTDTGASPNIFFQIPVPIPDPLPSKLSALKLKAAGILIDPVPHGALPATMPKWTLKYHTLTGTNVHTSIDDYIDIVDTSVDAAAFGAKHSITKTLDVALSSLDNSAGFIMQFVGEQGANSEAGLVVLAAWVQLGL